MISHVFSVNEASFDFAEVGTEKQSYHLRALRYTHTILPTPVKLVKCQKYQGVEIKVGGTVGICWRSFYGAFYETFNLLSYQPGSVEPDDDLSDQYKELSTAFSKQQIKSAWSQGVAMIGFYFSDTPTFSVDRLKVEDNYGNVVALDLKKWTVKNPVVII